jgi:phosphoribosylformylglycinamidine synthase subunit PurQ / glutaminase
MKRGDIRVGVLRIEGTNSEEESAACFRRLGAQAELVHLKQLLGQDTWPGEERRLMDYHVLFFPGGFSAGDYVRAGAIFAARLKTGLGPDLKEYVSSGRLMMGVCNGFQILTEAGLLPGLGALVSDQPEACLYTNDVGHYECRPVHLKHVNRGKSAFTGRIPAGEVRTIQSAHGEGKFLLDPERHTKLLKELEANDQVVFRYVGPDGDEGAGYPWNPSGVPGNVAAVCNREGNVFGMMPHPERVFYRHTHADWTRTGLGVRGDDVGDGRAVFESAVAYCERRF